MNERRGYVLAAVCVFVLGIASRRVPLDNLIWDKYLGDALYAVLFYLCLAICWPHGSTIGRTLATSVFVVCVECFQLTGIPMGWRNGESWLLKFVSVLLGTKFGWLDLISYAVGIVTVFMLDQWDSLHERTAERAVIRRKKTYAFPDFSESLYSTG